MNKIQEILSAFCALPPQKRRQTFMEVSGYPHYENVSSNILGFFLDPSGEHGLKDLLLSAFLQIAKGKDVAIPESIVITREHPADNQQRIDIVIDCESFTLGIENKIYHLETNDFENYGKLIDRLGTNKRVFKVLLSINASGRPKTLKGGFQRCTYNELWQNVSGRIDDYARRAEAKWVTFLREFMQTTTNLAGENMELNEMDRFFIDHHEDIERMVKEREAFRDRLHHKVATLQALVTEFPEAKILDRPPWVWNKLCVVLDFEFPDDHSIALDVWLSPKGWEFQFFARHARSNSYLNKLIDESPLKTSCHSAPVSKGRYLLEKLALEANLEDVAESLRKWMSTIGETWARKRQEMPSRGKLD